MFNHPGTLDLLRFLFCFYGVDRGDQHSADGTAVVLQRFILFVRDISGLMTIFLAKVFALSLITLSAKTITSRVLYSYSSTVSSYISTMSELYFYFVKVILKPLGFSDIIFASKLPKGQYNLQSKYNWHSQYSSPQGEYN